MGFLILLVLFIIVIIAFVVIKAFNDTATKGIEYKVPEHTIIENNPKIGDEVKFWLNPINRKINIYFKGSVSGQGKIGEINSIPDAKKLEKNELHAKICNITQYSIFIKFY